MRLFLLLYLTALLPLVAHADVLSSRLRLLLPGEDAPTVNERQFLYQRINGMWLTLEAKKVERKRTKKRIKRINEHLFASLFRRPVATARLADAFRTGSYNDATAALLLGLTYERFGVDYVAHVDHFRVYLVADPEGRDETILPPKFSAPTDKQRTAFRRQYVDVLRSTVLEDLPQLTPTEEDKIFFQHYYVPDRKLTLGQLAAFNYYRRAQAAYAAGEFAGAMALLETALLKEEQTAFLVLRTAAGLQLKAITQPTVEGDVSSLFRQWIEKPDNKYLPAALLQHFDEKQRLLLASNQVEATAQLLDDYLGRAPAGQEQWGNDLRQLRQYRLLRHYFVSGRSDLARELAEQLYEQNPGDEGIKFVLGEILIDGLRRTRLTGPAFTAAVEAVAQRYPFVREQNRFVNLLLRELAWNVRDRYEADDAAGGELALERFTDALVGIAVDEERSVWTLTAFLAVSNYHFRQENYVAARAYVDKGLAYNPRDSYLLHRRELLGRY